MTQFVKKMVATSVVPASREPAEDGAFFSILESAQTRNLPHDVVRLVVDEVVQARDRDAVSDSPYGAVSKEDVAFLAQMRTLGSTTKEPSNRGGLRAWQGALQHPFAARSALRAIDRCAPARHALLDKSLAASSTLIVAGLGHDTPRYLAYVAGLEHKPSRFIFMEWIKPADLEAIEANFLLIDELRAYKAFAEANAGLLALCKKRRIGEMNVHNFVGGLIAEEPRHHEPMPWVKRLTVNLFDPRVTPASAQNFCRMFPDLVHLTLDAWHTSVQGYLPTLLSGENLTSLTLVLGLHSRSQLVPEQLQDLPSTNITSLHLFGLEPERLNGAFAGPLAHVEALTISPLYRFDDRRHELYTYADAPRFFCALADVIAACPKLRNVTLAVASDYLEPTLSPGMARPYEVEHPGGPLFSRHFAEQMALAPQFEGLRWQPLAML